MSRYSKITSYVAVSLIVTFTDYIIFFILFNLVNIIIAQTIAYTTAIILSFQLHKNYVFGLYRKYHKAFIFVILFSLLGLLLSQILLYAYYYVTENIIFSKIMLTLTLLLYNYTSKMYAYGVEGL